jgi:hypothetical protein
MRVSYTISEREKFLNAAEVLFGAIPMQDMDVLVDPRQQNLVVSPKHLYVATKYLK